MQLDSTLTAVVIGLQAWSLKEIVSLKVSVATLTTEHTEMKKRLAIPLVTIVLLAFAAAFFSGCASSTGNPVSSALGKAVALPGKLAAKAADFVDNVATNITQRAVATTQDVITQQKVVTLDPVTQATETNVVSITNSVTVTNIVSTTNFVATLKPAIAMGVDGGKQLAGWLPPPFGNYLTIGLGAVSGILGLLTRSQQKQLDGKAATIDDLSGQLTATILGVESAVKKLVPPKPIIAQTAAEMGVGASLNATVQRVVADNPAT